MVQQFTTHTTLEELLESVDRSDLVYNAAMRRIDVMLSADAVDKRNTPPSSPVRDTAYIVGSAATGAWISFAENAIAYWDGVAWKSIPHRRATHIYDAALDEFFLMGGTGRLNVPAVSWVSQFGVTTTSTTTRYVCIPSIKCTIDRVILCSNLATTSNGSDNWSFQITNITDSSNTLFAATQDTDGALGDFTINVAKVLTPDQNVTVAANDVLSFSAILAGTPGDLGTFVVILDGHLRA